MDTTKNVIFSLRDGAKSFSGTTVLSGLNFDIHENEIIGIAGENGAGKSTTLKMLAGIHPPTRGHMTLYGEPYAPTRYTDAVRAGISMVFQEQALIPGLAVYENMFLSLEKNFQKHGHMVDANRMIALAEKELAWMNLSHIDPRRPVSDFGFYDRQMIEIAKAFVLAEFFDIAHPVILLDEPTAAIGEAEIKLLFEAVRRFKDRASFVLITHRLSEYLELCDRVIVLKDGEYVGEVEGDELREDVLHKIMVGRQRDEEYYKEDRQQIIGNDVAPAISVKNLSGEGLAKTGVTFDVHPGEILGLGGIVGCGKEQVVRAITGFEPFPTEGEVRIHGTPLPVKNRLGTVMDQRVGYVPKERKTEGIIPYMSVEANISLPLLDKISTIPGFLSRRSERRLARGYIKTLRIRTSGPGQLLQFLSGGNQQKVVLSKWLAREVDVLVLDNPTRGVDVGAKEEIYALLRDLTERGVAILLVTDDLLELIGLSNRILTMREGEVVAETAAPVEAKPTEHDLVAQMV